MGNSYPNPDHTSTRLSQQGSILYTILFFVPDLLNSQHATMREIVDKYFNDNWIIATYMGHLVDLTVEWGGYPAASSALENVLSVSKIQILNDRNANLTDRCLHDLKRYLKEGVLQRDFLLDNMKALIDCVRSCNIAIRWRILHHRCRNDTYRKIIHEGVSPDTLVSLLLNTSHLEYIMKELILLVLKDKESVWSEWKATAADRLRELAEYFTGEKALTRVKRDENLMNWFIGLADQVCTLDLEEDHATSTGRKIWGLTAALEDVEQVESVDSNMQIKIFLKEVRDILQQMIRTVNIKQEVINIIENLSDFSYAWGSLRDYIGVCHERIRTNPSSVGLLRATFLKAASILDVPLIRIIAVESSDSISVAEYYSSELVEFVRLVLEVIPVSVFKILSQIEHIQTYQMVHIPMKVEAKDLKNYSQLDLRFELSKLTHQVSIFTEGILVMEKTLLGVIQVDPRQILHQGLKRELVRQIATAMHDNIMGTGSGVSGISGSGGGVKIVSRDEMYLNMSRMATTLNGLKRSLEYLQDYIDINGLKIFQEELSRIINFNTEQELNKYLKNKVINENSKYQNKDTPIPVFPVNIIDKSRLSSSFYSSSLSSFASYFDSSSVLLICNDDMNTNNFMGGIMNSILRLTDFKISIYSPERSGWFNQNIDKKNAKKSKIDINDDDIIQVCGMKTLSLIEKSIGPIGMKSLDKLLGFRIVYELNFLLKFHDAEVMKHASFLNKMCESLSPEHRTLAPALYSTGITLLGGIMAPFVEFISRIGQAQLLRRQISYLLQTGCQKNANVLYKTLETYNTSLVNDICNKEKEEYHFSDDNNGVYELSALLEMCGLDDPLNKVRTYVHKYIMSNMYIDMNTFT
jgi:WASH complex subunit strumpellin